MIVELNLGRHGKVRLSVDDVIHAADGTIVLWTPDGSITISGSLTVGGIERALRVVPKTVKE